MLATAKNNMQTSNKKYIKKYGAFIRILHFTHLLSFLILALTGIALGYKLTGLGTFLFGSMKNAKDLHEIFGWILAVSGGILYLLLLPECIFKAYDIKWLAKAGGYLDPTHKTHAPAGRANAGQKMFFWYGFFALIITAVTGFSLMYNLVSPEMKAIFLSVHFIIAVLWIAAVIIHFYLATIANPGTIWSMINGKVSEDIVKVHNPEWYKELKEKNLL